MSTSLVPGSGEDGVVLKEVKKVDGSDIFTLSLERWLCEPGTYQHRPPERRVLWLT